MSKRNVTITLDEDALRWARVEAARQDTSVSQLVGDLLHEHMLRERNYDAAMRQYLAAEPRPLKRAEGYPQREAVHARHGTHRRVSSPESSGSGV